MGGVETDGAVRSLRDALPQGTGSTQDKHQWFAFLCTSVDECSIAPETKWLKSGKAAVMAALTGMDAVLGAA